MKPKAAFILALDLSAATGSLALLHADGSLRDARRWTECARGTPDLWRGLARLLETAGGVSALSLIVPGRGPGRYSGLRTGLAVAQALALPARIPVRAVDSGAALARAVFAERPGALRAAVAGDARRGQYWLGIYRNAEGWPEPEGDWRLCAADAPDLRLPAGTVGISPEWTRLPADLARESRGEWIQEDRSPDAVEVGRLALREQQLAREPHPLSPVYLHAAVAPAGSR